MNLRRFEHALLTLGLTLCVASLGVLAYREISSRMAIRSFEAAASGSQRIQTPVPVLEVGVAQPDYNLWSAKRIRRLSGFARAAVYAGGGDPAHSETGSRSAGFRRY